MAPRCAIALTLLACAALCVAQAADRATRAAQRVIPLLQPQLEKVDALIGAPVFLRGFKQEGEMELWVEGSIGWHLLKTYPICAWSGELGPKLAQGDRQTPEGIYRVGKRQLNPVSSYHLAFNLGYPNAIDSRRK